MKPAPAQLAIEGELPSLGSATGWLNSQPLTPAGLYLHQLVTTTSVCARVGGEIQGSWIGCDRRAFA